MVYSGGMSVLQILNSFNSGINWKQYIPSISGLWINKGVLALGNDHGLFIGEAADNNLIGDIGVKRNVISSNTRNGIWIDLSRGNQVAGK